MERVEVLLEQAAWVRALARKLARDEAQAEDLVQETWLAALEHAPAEEGRLRPWLARVLINFARAGRRGSAHRAERESVAARPERTPPTSETAERLEAQRMLVEALQSLAEPYRTTVTLRWLDGLSAAEIARREGVPAGTVRWRLKHGIDELRERLDRRCGGRRESFAIALMPLLRRPALTELAAEAAATVTAGGASAFVQMVVAMNTMTKLAIAATLALTASVGVWIAVDRPEEGAELVSAELPGEAVHALEAPPTADSARELAPPSVAESQERALATTEPAAEGSSAVARTGLEVRFLDSLDRPIEGVRLTLQRFPHISPPASGPDGRIAVELDPTRDTLVTHIEGAREGFATHFARATVDRGLTTYLGEVHLEPGGSVSGKVLDGDGRAFGDAQVIVISPEMFVDQEVAQVRGPWAGDQVPETRSQPDGSFRVDGVRAGLARVWAGSETTRWSFSEPIEVPIAAVAAGIELRLQPLEPEDHISGVVLSPEGEPVPGVEVRYQGSAGSNTWSGSLITKRDGRFRHSVPVRGPHDFHAHDSEDRWPDASALAVMPGTLDLVLQFPQPRWIELEVRGAAGAGATVAIETYSVTVLSADRSHALRGTAPEAHPNGLSRVLVPDVPFTIEVRARGRGTALLGPWAPDAAPAMASCTLERVPGIRGRVTRDGEPAAGVRVVLHEIAGEKTSIVRNGFSTRLHPESEDETTTDLEGFFELDPNRSGSADGTRFFQRKPGSPGTFAVLADVDGWALAEVAPLEVDPAIGFDGIEIALARGGAIEGRVLVAQGRDPAGVIVAADRTDGRPRTQRVGPEGRFRFENLTPGRWNVTRTEVEQPIEAGSTGWSSGDDVRPEYPWNCSVVDGETTRFDLDLLDDRSCVLVAQVTVNGAPAIGWTAKLQPTKNWTQALPGGAVDFQGTLRLETRDPAKWRLMLEPPAKTQKQVHFEVDVELSRGENPLPVNLAIGSVRGRVEVHSDDVSIEFHSAGSGSRPFRAFARPDASGRFELPIVPAGPGELRRMQTLAPGQGVTGPLATVQVDVPAGSAVEVTLP